MIIKKYRVDNIQEAMKKAKYELGPDAMILSQNKVSTGKWFNPFKKEKLEVILGIEEEKIEKDEDKELKEIIFKNPIYRDADREVRNMLKGYIKLNNLDRSSFSSSDSIEFINYIYKDNCFSKKEDLKKINILIGPTGVGKTTGIAKLAAREKLINKKKVGILTMDTYKIGGIEQIKAYAGILDLPFGVIESIRDIEEKIESFKNLDIIFIDTMGICQNNEDDLKKLKKYTSKIRGEKNILLALSVSTDTDINLSIIDKYELLEFEGLILTKFDELMDYQKFWSILENIKTPVNFISTGQEVPEDIKRMDLEKMISYIEDNIRIEERILN